MKIMAYYASWCVNCHIVVPKVEDWARRHGYQFEKVDVDDLSEELRETIDFVPHVLVDGHPMGDKELERIVNA